MQLQKTLLFSIQQQHLCILVPWGSEASPLQTEKRLKLFSGEANKKAIVLWFLESSPTSHLTSCLEWNCFRSTVAVACPLSTLGSQLFSYACRWPELQHYVCVSFSWSSGSWLKTLYAPPTFYFLEHASWLFCRKGFCLGMVRIITAKCRPEGGNSVRGEATKGQIQNPVLPSSILG